MSGILDDGFETKNDQEIQEKFREIMGYERQLNHVNLYTEELKVRYRTILNMSDYFFNVAWQVLETAKSSHVSRSYNWRYGLAVDDSDVLESVGAHANLVSTIASFALDYVYGAESGELYGRWAHTFDGFTYRHVMEAARIHDLAENEIGDSPDNKTIDDMSREAYEFKYFEKYVSRYPDSAKELRYSVMKLLRDMYDKSSPTGRLLYLSDKVAAIAATLCQDAKGNAPLIDDSVDLSERDKIQIGMCDYVSVAGKYRASEMWTIDFFKTRKLIKYDETLFFAALVVALTLSTHGKWYNWREKDYKA